MELRVDAKLHLSHLNGGPRLTDEATNACMSATGRWSPTTSDRWTGRLTNLTNERRVVRCR